MGGSDTHALTFSWMRRGEKHMNSWCKSGETQYIEFSRQNWLVKIRLFIRNYKNSILDHFYEYWFYRILQRLKKVIAWPRQVLAKVLMKRWKQKTRIHWFSSPFGTAFCITRLATIKVRSEMVLVLSLKGFSYYILVTYKEQKVIFWLLFSNRNALSRAVIRRAAPRCAALCRSSWTQNQNKATKFLKNRFIFAKIKVQNSSSSEEIISQFLKPWKSSESEDMNNSKSDTCSSVSKGDSVLDSACPESLEELSLLCLSNSSKVDIFGLFRLFTSSMEIKLHFLRKISV